MHPDDLGDVRATLPADHKNNAEQLLEQLERDNGVIEATSEGPEAKTAWMPEPQPRRNPKPSDVALDLVLGGAPDDSDEETFPVGETQQEVGSIPAKGAREVIVDDTDVVRSCVFNHEPWLLTCVLAACSHETRKNQRAAPLATNGA